MTRRSSLFAIALLSAACSKTYSIEPATGGTVGTASTTGITMTAEPNAWSGHPTDLDDYLTPIWIGIVNQRSEDVRVSYADFALTDDSGFRYAAISPYTGQAEAAPPGNAPPAPPAKSPPAKPPPPNQPPPAAEPPPDETNGGWSEMRLLPGEGGRPAPLLASFELTRYGGHGGAHVGGHVYVGPHPGRGFYVHPHYRGYFHYYTPWPYFYYWPPYYGAYVYYWNYRYYPAPPSYDVMRLGLPEGVVKSGGSVSGFVYFQNAANRPKNLKLTWAVYRADGKAIASLDVPFVIVED
jgi:hypothetical protein